MIASFRGPHKILTQQDWLYASRSNSVTCKISPAKHRQTAEYPGGGGGHWGRGVPHFGTIHFYSAKLEATIKQSPVRLHPGTSPCSIFRASNPYGGGRSLRRIGLLPALTGDHKRYGLVTGGSAPIFLSVCCQTRKSRYMSMRACSTGLRPLAVTLVVTQQHTGDNRPELRPGRKLGQVQHACHSLLI